MSRETWLVTADHVAPEYVLTREPVSVCAESDGRGFYVTHRKLGCSKTRETAEAAIRQMMAEAGYTSVRCERDASVEWKRGMDYLSGLIAEESATAARDTVSQLRAAIQRSAR